MHISIPTDVTWPWTADCNTQAKQELCAKGKQHLVRFLWQEILGLQTQAGAREGTVYRPTSPAPSCLGPHGGMFLSPIIPSGNLLLSLKTPLLLPHRTSTQAWFFRHRNEDQLALVTLWYPQDFCRNHAVYFLPLCKSTLSGIFSVASRSICFLSSHSNPMPSPTGSDCVCVPTLKSSADQRNAWQARGWTDDPGPEENIPNLAPRKCFSRACLAPGVKLAG